MILWRRLALLVGILVTKTVSEEPKLVIPGPAERRPALGINLFMECMVIPSNIDSISNIRWLNPRGQEIDEKDPRIYTEESQDKVGRSLYIQKIEEQDGGMYTCEATFSGNPNLRTSVTLTIYKEITFVDCPLIQNPIAGENALIKCAVHGNPPPIVDWRRNNIIISTNIDGRYKIEDNGLLIKNFGQDDDDIYQCRARVVETGSLKYQDIKVEVHIVPKFTETPIETRKVEGETIALSCKATGKPEPQYVWTRRLEGANFEELPSDRFSADPKSGTLTIRDLQHNDRGYYQCRAWSAAGEVTDGAELLVILKPKIKNLLNVTESENGIASLICEATGEPLPKITWQKVGSHIPFVEGSQPNDQRISVNVDQSGSSHLTINPLIRADDGLYRCTATNEGGEFFQNGHITVQFKPVLSSKTPSINYYTWLDNPINMTCIAEAVPNATVTWNRIDNNLKIKDNPNFVVYGGTSISSLQVTPIDAYYFGDYICSADNALGHSELTIQLRQAVPPGLIQNVIFKLVTATTITFEFDGPREDGGRPILGYQVEYYKDGVSQTAAQSRFLSIGNPYIVDNLEPEQTYYFSVSAKNDVGLGQMIRTESLRMPAIGPPLTPLILSSNVSEHAAKYFLHWMESLSNGAPIKDYSIRIWKVDKPQDKMLYNVFAPAVNFWVEGLQPSTTYKVELRAQNKLGYSQPADVIFTTAKGAGDTHSKPMTGSVHNGLTSGAVVGIVIAVILVLLLIVDISCYTMYQCGVLMFLCIKVCGKQPPAAKAKEMAMEEGKVNAAADSKPNNGDAVSENVNNIVTDDKEVAAKDDKIETEVDNPAFDKEKEPIKQDEVNEKDMDEKQEEQEEEKEASEVTPMIEGNGKEKEAYEKEVTVDNIDVEIKDKPAEA